MASPIIRRVLPIIVSLGILAYIIRTVASKEDIAAILGNLSGTYVFLACVVALAANWVLVARWRSLLVVAGYPLPQKHLLKIFAANLPIAKFTPGYTGDFLRSYFLREHVPVRMHLGIIFLEAIFDVVTLLCIAIIGSMVIGNSTYAIVSSICLFAILGVLFLIYTMPPLIPEKFRGYFTECIEILRITFQNPHRMIPTLGLTFLASILSPLYVYILFMSSGASLSLYTVFAVQPIVMVVTLIPISLWGLGIRESAMLFLYSGVASGIVVSVGLLYTLIGSILIPLLCIPFTYTIIRDTLHTLTEESR